MIMCLHEGTVFLGLIVFLLNCCFVHNVMCCQQGFYSAGYYPEAEPEAAGSSSLFDDEAVRTNISFAILSVDIKTHSLVIKNMVTITIMANIFVIVAPLIWKWYFWVTSEEQHTSESISIHYQSYHCEYIVFFTTEDPMFIPLLLISVAFFHA